MNKHVSKTVKRMAIQASLFLLAATILIMGASTLCDGIYFLIRDGWFDVFASKSQEEY